MIFLDSDVLIEILEKNSIKSDKIFETLEMYANEEVVISELVLEEVFFGILKVTHNKQLLDQHPIFEIPVVEFNKQDALLAAEIGFEMEKLGKKKPRVDSLIASSVINQQGSLFTLNTRHYHDIKNLNLIPLQ
ncbi:MAG: type II toxin-antitoxin system VapC family toxin [Candidatus Heimdallarchaeota archaeon]